MGDEDGPVWVKDGWVFGYKLWVGDLPSDINSKVIGQCCVGYKGHISPKPQDTLRHGLCNHHLH